MRPLLTPGGLTLLDTLDAVARRHRVQPAAIALAWLLRRPTVTAPLVSATSPGQLAELLAAPTVSLDAAELERITAAADARDAEPGCADR